MSRDLNFESFFEEATGHNPYPYQTKLATSESLPEVIDIPTGMGKTDAVVLGWLWRRRFDPREEVRTQTPRRLVYCLPMRALVEQTRDKANGWLRNLKLLADKPGGNDGIAVTVLMGGEGEEEWDLYPEREAIIIGTQDMLLSRALNRGYGMSRYRWPVHFGLLNNDCLWVMDEMQLMGVGVETSAQMQAFCKSFGTFYNVQYIWMSATVGEKQLETVDHPRTSAGWSRVALADDDKVLHSVLKLFGAKKAIFKSTLKLDKETERESYSKEFTDLLLKTHKVGTLTLAVVNRVKHAQDIYKELLKKDRTEENTAVLHSRFRKGDREARLELLDETQDRIIVATQVVEAGVDVSAHTLVTELSPWPSLVQRFGRCNRRGEYDDAVIMWIDIDTGEEDLCLPYDSSSMENARLLAESIRDAGLKTLSAVDFEEPAKIRPVLRRKDILDLFDTTPDLTGNDLDVSRFIRDGEDKDVQVYWRELYDDEAPAEPLERPRRDELCPVSISQINQYLRKHEGWVWDPLDGRWGSINSCRPGQVILLHPKDGGYSQSLGWVGLEGNGPVSVVPKKGAEVDKGNKEPLMDEDDESKIGRWVPLIEHIDDVWRLVRGLSETLELAPQYQSILEIAAKRHDVGKLHLAFQNMLRSSRPDGTSIPAGGPWAKSETDGKFSRPLYWVEADDGRKIRRPYFRHELASALIWLQTDGRNQENGDLVAYLIAAHHGKVRMSIRSLPKEVEPPEETRLFARGIWDGDELPPLEGVQPEGIKLDLSIMQMGKGSWLERMLRLRDDQRMGPFRLAFLESLLRMADWRASQEERRAKK